MYSVVDSAAEEYGYPFVAKTENVAVRQFRNLMEQVPEYSRKDFQLVELGCWNADYAGQDVNPLSVKPRVDFVCNGEELVKIYGKLEKKDQEEIK